MKFWGRSAAITVLLLASSSVTAKGLYVLGVGGTTCGAFIQASKRSPVDTGVDNSSGSFPSLSTTYMQWARGYVTAIKMAQYKRRDPRAVKEVDAAAMTTWLENYCNTNPETPWVQAVEDFANR